MSENFFIKKALVPSEGYFQEKTTQLQGAVSSRFSWITDIRTMFSSIQMSETTGGIANLNCTLPIVGNVTVVNFKFLNDHASFIRGLCSAFIYILCGVYVIKQAPKLLGSMN